MTQKTLTPKPITFGDSAPKAQVRTDSAPRGVGLFARIVSAPATPVIAGIVLALAAGVAYINTSGGAFIGKPDIVTFDPVKFLNSQRAAASLLAISQDPSAALTITQVAKQAEKVIKEEAAGAVIIVRQALVVTDGVVDITDRVLERFGLPTNVPTVTTQSDSLEYIAPTDAAFSSGAQAENYREEVARREMIRQEEDSKKNKQDRVLP